MPNKLIKNRQGNKYCNYTADMLDFLVNYFMSRTYISEVLAHPHPAPQYHSPL